MIQHLPDHIINRIKAGEVIDRPAAIIKELVENAIDANATKITVKINGSWSEEITVEDNGGGMSADDAKLAIQRHTTSKITTAGDIANISTLGFRGEALASIAAVSNLTVTTRANGAGAGTELVVHGGKIVSRKPCAAPIGTTIAVRDLFYNTPARKKFLKSDRYELKRMVDCFSTLTFPFTHCGFELYVRSRLTLHYPRQSTLLDRIHIFAKNDVMQAIIPLVKIGDTDWVTGYITHPHWQRNRPTHIYTYVNQRLITNRTIIHAITSGYENLLMRGTYPFAVLSLTLPPSQIDVNTHPTKQDIAFRDASRLFKGIREIVQQTLRHNRDTLPPQYTAYSAPTAPPRIPFSPQTPATAHTSNARIQPPTLAQPAIDPERSCPSDPFTNRPTLRFSDYEHIGTVAGTYLILKNSHALLLLDQHAVHERITFDTLIHNTQSLNQYADSVQLLLVPEIIELNTVTFLSYHYLKPYLTRFGIDTDVFGETTIAVRAIPGVLSHANIEQLIRDLLELDDIPRGRYPESDPVYQKFIRKMASRACRSSIQANDPLTKEEVSALLAKLDQTEHPATCPHGRPTYIHWDHTALERLFKRKT